MEKTDDTPLFHPKEKHSDVEHHGFTGKELEEYIMKNDRFDKVKVEKVFSIRKIPVDKPAEELDFGVLLLVGVKR